MLRYAAPADAIAAAQAAGSRATTVAGAIRALRAQVGHPRHRPLSQLAATDVWRDAGYGVPSDKRGPVPGGVRNRAQWYHARRTQRLTARGLAHCEALGLWPLDEAEAEAARYGHQLALDLAAVGRQIAEAVPLTAGPVAIRYGRGGQIVEDRDRYSRSWHRSYGPSRWCAAGIRAEREWQGRRADVAVVEDYRGRVVLALDLAILRADGWRAAAAAAVLADPIAVLRTTNVERRRALLGLADPAQLVAAIRAASGSRRVRAVTDERGTLWTIPLAGDEDVQYVQVRDASTDREYWLRVPPDVESAHAAVAWTYGLRPEAYAPVAEA